MDLDGVNDVLWGRVRRAPDRTISTSRTGEAEGIKAQTEDLDGPFVGPQVGTWTATGSTRSWPPRSHRNRATSGPHRRHRFAHAGCTRDFARVADGVYAWTGIHDLKLRDLNGDGRLEIPSPPTISTMDCSRLIPFRRPTSSSGCGPTPPGQLVAIQSVDVADIDGDGDLEVLAGGSRRAWGVYIYAYDVATRSGIRSNSATTGRR